MCSKNTQLTGLKSIRLHMKLTRIHSRSYFEMKTFDVTTQKLRGLRMCRKRRPKNKDRRPCGLK